MTKTKHIEFTDWSQPKRNFFQALNDLRKVLNQGLNAKLIKKYNEDCLHPIRIKNEINDFRCYESYIGYACTREKIMADNTLSETQKYLALNYINCFGTEEAMKHYYETGELSEDNFKGMGRSHLVKATDRIKFIEDNLYESGGDMHIANLLKRQYVNPNYTGSHLFSFFKLKNSKDEYSIKKFRRKLWVVVLLSDKKIKVPVLIKIMNVLAYPLKYIPRKRVLDMDEYKKISFTIGSIINGFTIEFQIPKKFSF